MTTDGVITNALVGQQHQKVCSCCKNSQAFLEIATCQFSDHFTLKKYVVENQAAVLAAVMPSAVFTSECSLREWIHAPKMTNKVQSQAAFVFEHVVHASPNGRTTDFCIACANQAVADKSSPMLCHLLAAACDKFRLTDAAPMRTDLQTRRATLEPLVQDMIGNQKDLELVEDPQGWGMVSKHFN